MGLKPKHEEVVVSSHMPAQYVDIVMSLILIGVLISNQSHQDVSLTNIHKKLFLKFIMTYSSVAFVSTHYSTRL